jgi:hypothetical protein
MIPDFATLEECAVLQEAALELEAAWDVEHEHGGKSHVHVLAASESNKNCTRYSVEAVLNAKAKAMSAIFLARLLTFLQGNDDEICRDEQMADLALQVFQHDTNLNDLKVEWYAEPDDCNGHMIPEPKVNIYKKGGFFVRHGDGMQLTLLVMLNDNHMYQGGGTAFFRTSAEENEDDQSTELAPDSIARPQAGTAMIWGGTLDHMALPVTEGSRAVFVGSFDLKQN